MNDREAYKNVKTDDYTYRLLFSRMGGMQPYEPPVQQDAPIMGVRRCVTRGACICVCELIRVCSRMNPLCSKVLP